MIFTNCSKCTESKMCRKKLYGEFKDKFLCECCNRKVKKAKGECSFCHKVKIIVACNKENKPLCNVCYKDDLSHGYAYKIGEEKCSLCNHVRPVSLRNEEGAPICLSCAMEKGKKLIRCPSCKKRKINVAKHNEKPICQKCFDRQNKVLTVQQNSWLGLLAQ